MSYVDRVKISSNTYAYPVTPLYCTCTTAAATTAKAASLADTTYSLGASSSTANNIRTAGVLVAVRFTYANTAASPTLNVASSGACPIYKYGSTSPGSGAWSAGEVVLFVYDKTNNTSGCWMQVAFQTATAGSSNTGTETGKLITNTPAWSASTAFLNNSTTFSAGSTPYTASVSGEVLTLAAGTAPSLSKSTTTGYVATTTPSLGTSRSFWY